jgi:two-component system response regulator FixJ
MTECTVHVIDDDDAARASLTFLLESSGFAVIEYPSADAFLERLDTVAAGCVVTDLRMPGMSGLDLVRRLRQTGRPFAVIVVTGHGEVPLAVEAMKEGALDFIEKPYSGETMLAAVRAAVDRQGREAAGKAEAELFRARLARLSAREREVLAGLVAGKVNKQIAFDLSISPRTVEIYRANVMMKMEAGSLPELVRMALVAEWRSGDPPGSGPNPGES